MADVIGEGGNNSEFENHPEFQAMRALGHPGIIPCYDAFVHDGHLVMIYELCEGGSLQDMIGAECSGLSFARFRDIASQLVQALAFVHAQNLAHSDIKPSNILFADPARRRVRLTDFGLCRPHVHLRSIAGTPNYQSPEIWSGELFDPLAADVWALGVCFCVMAQGTLPWSGLTSDDVISQIAACAVTLDCDWPEVVSVIRRMLTPEALRVTAAELAAMPLFQCAVASRPEPTPPRCPVVPSAPLLLLRRPRLSGARPLDLGESVICDDVRARRRRRSWAPTLKSGEACPRSEAQQHKAMIE